MGAEARFIEANHHCHVHKPYLDRNLKSIQRKLIHHLKDTTVEALTSRSIPNPKNASQINKHRNKHRDGNNGPISDFLLGILSLEDDEVYSPTRM